MWTAIENLSSKKKRLPHCFPLCSQNLCWYSFCGPALTGGHLQVIRWGSWCSFVPWLCCFTHQCAQAFCTSFRTPAGTLGHPNHSSPSISSAEYFLYQKLHYWIVNYLVHKSFYRGNERQRILNSQNFKFFLDRLFLVLWFSIFFLAWLQIGTSVFSSWVDNKIKLGIYSLLVNTIAKNKSLFAVYLKEQHWIVENR